MRDAEIEQFVLHLARSVKATPTFLSQGSIPFAFRKVQILSPTFIEMAPTEAGRGAGSAPLP